MFEEENNDEFLGGDLRDDLNKFERFLKGEPMGFIDSDRWEILIDHFLMNGQFKNAAVCADEALSQFSYNSSFQLKKAQSYSAIGKLKEAINIIAEIERKGESSFEIILTKASIFSQLKDSKNAIRFFKEGLKLADKEDRDEIYIDLAAEYEVVGDYDKAINVLKNAIKDNPDNESAIYEIAYCYDQIGDFKKSIDCYSKFIDENPYSFTSWYNLGNAYSKLNNHEKAIWAFDYCLLINEEFAPVYFNLANVYLSNGKYRKAIENFHKCMEIDGDDPVAFCYIGECHEQLNELELARLFYNKSLELAPVLPDAWLGLGIVTDLEGDTRGALTFIQKALELDPGNASIYHVLAGAYEKLEEIIEAYDFYELSLGIDPSDKECLANYCKLIALQDGVNSALDVSSIYEEENEIVPVLSVGFLWELDKKLDAIFLFTELLENNRENAMELFDIFPALKSEKVFIELSDNK